MTEGHPAMADHSHHTHGSMDIRAQSRTFDGFIRFVGWSLVVIFGVLVFMALANS